MKVKIDVETQTFIRLGLVILGFVFAIFLLIRAQQPLTIIAVALFLALALNPPVSYISRKLPSRSRVGATALAYVTVITLIGGVLFLVIPPLVEQSSKFASTVPQIIDTASAQRGFFNNFVTQYGLEDQVNASIESTKQQASSVAQDLGGLLVAGVATIFNGALTTLIVLVLTFLMLIEGPMWMKRIWGLYQDPVLLDRHRTVVQKMYRVVVGYVNGQMLVALIASMATLVSLLLLTLVMDLPGNLALPLAAIVFLTSLVPMVGATIGAFIVTLVLLLNNMTAAIIFLIYFIVYQQIENNFISPTIQSKKVELSALSVLASILIGVSLFGLLGGIVAIPIAGCIRVLLVDYLDHASDLRDEKTSKNPLSNIIRKVKES
ncbi:MAG: AI-2E family transporter [Candidatus Saccharimonadales bacterium]